MTERQIIVTSDRLPTDAPDPQWRHMVTVDMGTAELPIATCPSPWRAELVRRVLQDALNRDPKLLDLLFGHHW